MKYFILLKIQDMDINVFLLQWFALIFFDKKPAISKGTITGFDTVSDNQQWAKWLNVKIIRKLSKGKVYLFIKDNIWGADLAGVQLISKYIKRIPFLLWVVDIFSKYAWVASLKNKKSYHNYWCFSKNFRWIWS